MRGFVLYSLDSHRAGWGYKSSFSLFFTREKDMSERIDSDMN